MQKRILPLAITAITLFSLFGWNCTKLDTTDIGSDLLPAVDNVHTFDTTLFINSTQESYYSDSTYISKYDDYAVGSISNDPLFGSTKASIYMQLKPPFYPYYFGSPGDTINKATDIDSVVLCLRYKGFWGDSTVPVHLEVQEVFDYIFKDSVYKEYRTNYKPNVTGTVLATANIDVRTLGNYIKLSNGRDSVNNQIRIKLPASWAAQLFGRDSTKNGPNNAFYNDSLYRVAYHGIAVIGGNGGNGLMYASLADTATKLEIHYRKKTLGAGGKIDSVYSSFRLNPVADPSGAANAPRSNTSNYILRNRSALVLNPPAGEHYLQTAPGTFVNLNIPGLAGLSNRIIHRAEIIVEQIPTNAVLDEVFSTPNFLYLDLKDTGTANKWKPLYFDLNTSELYDPDYKTTVPYLPSQINYQYYGAYRRSKTDVFGNPIKYYNINVSRYVQQIVTNHTPVYNMRLYAPFNLNYPQYSVYDYSAYGNNIAFGRIRIGSGTNPNYRLRLRIVYSKL